MTTLYYTIIGAIIGWFVGLFFGNAILSVLGSLGITGIAMWQIGAVCGFIKGFFSKD